MTDKPEDKAFQRQDSRQSALQDDPKRTTPKPASEKRETRSGMGSSQGQDSGAPTEREGARPSAGTADIERGGPQDPGRGHSESTESLVDDPTGAFKERP